MRCVRMENFSGLSDLIDPIDLFRTSLVLIRPSWQLYGAPWSPLLKWSSKVASFMDQTGKVINV
jgi:hypothetical protein